MCQEPGVCFCARLPRPNCAAWYFPPLPLRAAVGNDNGGGGPWKLWCLQVVNWDRLDGEEGDAAPDADVDPATPPELKDLVPVE